MILSEDDFQSLSDILLFLDSWHFDDIREQHAQAESCKFKLSSIIDRFIECEENKKQHPTKTSGHL